MNEDLTKRFASLLGRQYFIPGAGNIDTTPSPGDVERALERLIQEHGNSVVDELKRVQLKCANLTDDELQLKEIAGQPLTSEFGCLLLSEKQCKEIIEKILEDREKNENRRANKKTNRINWTHWFISILIAIAAVVGWNNLKPVFQNAISW